MGLIKQLCVQLQTKRSLSLSDERRKVRICFGKDPLLPSWFHLFLLHLPELQFTTAMCSDEGIFFQPNSKRNLLWMASDSK